ncbi:MAG: zinc ribbon domain-containing protein, partial [Cyanobacteriota bacterium]|nr:zinc ribbon domain-containing protein [Cyanobacteriota bacterium]
MYSPTRGPERLVRIAQWLIALVFAFFLIRVGGAILADLPVLTQPPQQATFLQTPPIRALEARIQPLEAEREALDQRLTQLQQRQEVARQAYETERASFETWRATRSATQQTSQNQDVIARARQLDAQLQGQQRLRD